MLIRRNNRWALEGYYQDAEAKNQIPDYPRSNNVPTLTESIRYVNNIALLDITVDLLRLTCRAGFGDEVHFGLRNSCCSALRNMAMAHYDEVFERLTEERKSEDQMYRLTCVDIITSITSEDLGCADVRMAFESALALTAG